jgi:site-specific DNA-methyltransferase (adenine-specific)
MSVYYQDDYVTLYHGDCLEHTEWLDADVLVTDPPYGIAWQAGGLNDKASVRAEAVQSIVADEDTNVRDNMLELWGDRPSVVFGSWRKPLKWMPNHRLIWHKSNRQPGITSAAFYPIDEEIWLTGSGWQGKPPLASIITTNEHRGIQPKLIGHPTPKPIGLMETLISRCPDGVIGDPFAGSGATLIAARNLGRKAIGVELEEKYCEIIASRLANQTFDFSQLEN